MDTTRTPKPDIQTVNLLARLRPRDIGGLLDQAVALYRRNFITYVGIAAVMQVPASVLLAVASIVLLDPATLARTTPTRAGGGLANAQAASVAALSDTLSRFLLYMVIAVCGAILTNIAAAALARAIAAGYMGRSLSIVDAYRAIRRQIPRLIGLIVLLGLSSALLMIPPLFLWIFINWTFATQAIVLEDASVSSALQRSWDLVRGSWWRVFGAYLLLLIVGVIVGFADVLVTPLLAALGLSWALQNIVAQFISLLTALVYVPIRLAGITLLYFDLRVRKEGFDLQVALDERAGDLGLVPVLAGPGPGGAPPAAAWPYQPAAPATGHPYQQPARG